jgi:hypothetical protein
LPRRRGSLSRADEDSFDEVGNTFGADAHQAQDLPTLQDGEASFARCAMLAMGAVGAFLEAIAALVKIQVSACPHSGGRATIPSHT